MIPPQKRPRPEAFDGHIGWRNDDLERSLGGPIKGRNPTGHRSHFHTRSLRDGNGNKVTPVDNGKNHTDPGFWKLVGLVVWVGLLFIFGWAVVPVFEVS